MNEIHDQYGRNVKEGDMIRYYGEKNHFTGKAAIREGILGAVLNDETFYPHLDDSDCIELLSPETSICEKCWSIIDPETPFEIDETILCDDCRENFDSTLYDKAKQLLVNESESISIPFKEKETFKMIKNWVESRNIEVKIFATNTSWIMGRS